MIVLMSNAIDHDTARKWDRQCDRACYFFRFRRFHSEHPEVYTWMVKRTQRFYDEGHRKTGIEFLMNSLRWKALASPAARAALGIPDDQEEYAINQNYAAYYARLIAREHPHLVEMFNKKASHADTHETRTI